MMELQQALSQDYHLQKLKNIIIAGWPDSKEEIIIELKAVLVIQG